MTRKKALSQARTRRRLYPTAVRMTLAASPARPLKIAAAEMALVLHVPDHGLYSRAASELAFDDAEHAVFLPGDEHAARVCGVVAAISLVDIAALDGAADELFRGVDNGAERVSVIWIARQRRGVQHELTTGPAGIGGDDRGFDAETLKARGPCLRPCIRPRGPW